MTAVRMHRAFQDEQSLHLHLHYELCRVSETRDARPACSAWWDKLRHSQACRFSFLLLHASIYIFFSFLYIHFFLLIVFALLDLSWPSREEYVHKI